MRILVIFGEILPVLGTVGLLGLWLYQQTAIEQRGVELRAMAGARAVYQTYQSNNALFNAIIEIVAKDKKASEQVRNLQIYNYELGLSAIENVLPEQEKASIPPPLPAYDSSATFMEKLDQIQKRLEVLQTKLSAREDAIRIDAEAARKKYLWLFGALSLVSIAGALCKLFDKFLV